MKKIILFLLLLSVVLAGPFDAITNAVNSITGKKSTPQQNQKANDLLAAGGQVLKGIAGIGPKEEAIIGDCVALELVSKYGGLSHDTAALRRMNLVGRSLTRYSERADANWRFGILNSESVNAFSAPDGWVFITHGLYVLARNDDALAGILGHEISHVTGRHALKILEGTSMLSGALGALSATNKDAAQVKANLQQFDFSIEKIASVIMEKGFSQDTEFQADKDGHNLARMSGYAGGGLRSVLVLLENRGGDPKQMFPTHPPLRDRIARLPDEPAPRL